MSCEKYILAAVFLFVGQPLAAARPRGVSSAGKDYYVSVSGNDLGNGSRKHPWKTISHAARHVRPGATVHVASGTYYGDVVTTATGTRNARVRFVSDQQWAAKIVGDGTSVGTWVNGDIHSTGTPTTGNYVDIVGFEITGNQNSTAGITNYASSVHIFNNKVHNVGIASCRTSRGVSGIVAGANYDASDEWVDNNVVYNLPTDMVNVPLGCTDVVGIYFANARGHAYNNLVYDVAEDGMQTNHYANGVVFANNTVFHNGYGPLATGTVCHGDGIEMSDSEAILDYSTIINNIAYDNCNYGIRDYRSTGSHNLYANNLLFRNGSGKDEVFFQCNPACNRKAEHTLKLDPQFVSYQPDGSGNYRLRAGSPAIDQGTTKCASGPEGSCVPADDADAGQRPANNMWDIGAYEFGAARSDMKAESTPNNAKLVPVPR
jgi:hypothetical protein